MWTDLNKNTDEFAENPEQCHQWVRLNLAIFSMRSEFRCSEMLSCSSINTLLRKGNSSVCSRCLLYIFATYLSALAAILCNKASSQIFGSSWTTMATIHLQMLNFKHHNTPLCKSYVHVFGQIRSQAIFGLCHFFASTAAILTAVSGSTKSFRCETLNKGSFWEIFPWESPHSAVWSTRRNTWAEGTTKTQQPSPRLENNGIFIEQRWLIITLQRIPTAIQQYLSPSDNNLWG